jgi:hypothetical protein
VVQGERGFWTLLTPESAAEFLDAGWYGVGTDPDPERSAERLAGILAGLVADPAGRARLGDSGRRLVVERFSLARAAELQETVYATALADPLGRAAPSVAADALRSGAGVLRHKVRRRWQRVRGTVATDDFNAAAVLHQPGGTQPLGAQAAGADRSGGER